MKNNLYCFRATRLKHHGGPFRFVIGVEADFLVGLSWFVFAVYVPRYNSRIDPMHEEADKNYPENDQFVKFIKLSVRYLPI